MGSQPRDWDPEPNVLYQCLNCDCLFARPELLIMFGEKLWACPECQDIEFFSLANDVVRAIYWHIIASSYPQSERMHWRTLAEATMQPYDPATRDL